ncbi:hypothetical protein JK643_18565 [Marinobacter sp. JB05H06]|uniref:hypothetical protein n=1 Tax=Marinobacter denitrificans TaxID=2597703 RepID=UPI00124835D4|nr:hypothetical protein [Marinobacter denitrificans]MBL3558394.1 hypothetical protein [Marinobacter sp. JB05H06]
MVPDIRVGKIGVVLAGENIGWQIRVEDDSVNTGGYLVLTSRDFTDPHAEAFDDWVEDEGALQEYFRESGWVVKWH